MLAEIHVKIHEKNNFRKKVTKKLSKKLEGLYGNARKKEASEKDFAVIIFQILSRDK